MIVNLIDLGRHDPVPLGERAIDEHTAVLDPIEVGSLVVFPVVQLPGTRNEDGPDTPLSLDEAMATHLVRIRELPDGRVDTLQLANAADRPVFVLAGEVILGGKQDRVIAANTIVPPHTTIEVAVRCVEKGRWSETIDGTFTTASTLAHDRLRGSATYAGQSEVWTEVARANALAGTSNATDTYRALATRQATDAARGERVIDDALAELPVDARRAMIGYVVAYDGEVAAVDMFGSPALFAKLERKLLRSYLAQAASPAAETTRPPCLHAIRDFLANARRGASEVAGATTIQRGTVASTAWIGGGLTDRHLYANYLGNARIGNGIAARALPAEPGERRFICDRHLYPGYQGSSWVNENCWDPPIHDRRLYPSYLGNNPRESQRPASPDRAASRSDAEVNGRLIRTNDLPVMRCDSLYPGNISSTREWNACRRALGLEVPAGSAPDPVCTGDRLPYQTRTRGFRDAEGCYSACDPARRHLGGNPDPACVGDD